MNVEITGLTRRFGRTMAVAGADLTAGPGVFGLLGPNGAGKTTAVRIFATLLRPDRGRARVMGHDVVTQAGQVRRSIGLNQHMSLRRRLSHLLGNRGKGSRCAARR